MKKFLISVYIFLLLSLLVALFIRPITSINEDLGRHILFGKIITHSLNVPNINLLSYTNSQFPFINATWMSAVYFYALHLTGGFNFVLFGNFLIVVLAILIQLRFVEKRFSMVSILTSCAIYLILLESRSDVRPEIFTMLFLSLYVVILQNFIEGKKDKLFFLIPIQFLWVNFHIYFFVGPILILFFLVSSKFGSGKKSDNFKKLFKILLGVIVVCFFNPNGYKGAFFPFLVFQNYAFPVTENQDLISLFLVYAQRGIFLPMIVVLMLIFLQIFFRKKAKLHEFLITLFFSVALIFVFRNITLFIFGTFIFFNKYIDLIIKKAKTRITRQIKITLIFAQPLFMLILALLIYQTVKLNSFGFGVLDRGKVSVDFIVSNNINGRIFNNFDIGGYLSYRLYPQLVYIDGRPEAYSENFIEGTYKPMLEKPELFEMENSRYKFNLVVLKHWDETPWKDKLIKYLLTKSNFKLVHVDSYAVVFVNNTDANKILIKKFAIDLKEFKLSNNLPLDEMVRYLFFFEKSGEHRKAREVFKNIADLDPSLCSLKKYPLAKSRKISFIGKKDISKICTSTLLF